MSSLGRSVNTGYKNLSHLYISVDYCFENLFINFSTSCSVNRWNSFGTSFGTIERMGCACKTGTSNSYTSFHCLFSGTMTSTSVYSKDLRFCRVWSVCLAVSQREQLARVNSVNRIGGDKRTLVESMVLADNLWRAWGRSNNPSYKGQLNWIWRTASCTEGMLIGLEHSGHWGRIFEFQLPGH